MIIHLIMLALSSAILPGTCQRIIYTYDNSNMHLPDGVTAQASGKHPPLSYRIN